MIKKDQVISSPRGQEKVLKNFRCRICRSTLPAVGSSWIDISFALPVKSVNYLVVSIEEMEEKKRQKKTGRCKPVALPNLSPSNLQWYRCLKHAGLVLQTCCKSLCCSYCPEFLILIRPTLSRLSISVKNFEKPATLQLPKHLRSGWLLRALPLCAAEVWAMWATPSLKHLKCKRARRKQDLREWSMYIHVCSMSRTCWLRSLSFSWDIWGLCFMFQLQ